MIIFLGIISLEIVFMSNKYKENKGFSFLELVVIIVIAIILAALPIPNFKRSEGNDYRRHCASNVRVIIDAVEMYNMDAYNGMSSLDLEILVEKGYLKTRISVPTKECKYCSLGDLSKKDKGTIYCEYHGDSVGFMIKPGMKFDEYSFERKLFIEEQERKKAEEKDKKQKEIKMQQIILVLFWLVVVVLIKILFPDRKPKRS